MRIQVLTNSNGYGLSKDVQVIREALEPMGHTVEFNSSTGPVKRGKWDVNIHVEHLVPKAYSTADSNIAIPNADWFNPLWKGDLKGIDTVVAKTYDAARIFSEFHANVIYTGWTSPDTNDRVDYSIKEVVHVAGLSWMKGTHSLSRCLSTMPEVTGTVCSSRRLIASRSKGIAYIHHRVGDAEFAEIRRAPIHLCPSTYEGFGHYINEARALGAVVITTNAAPMNELVTSDTGILVPHTNNTRTFNLSPQYLVDEGSLCDAIQMAWNATPEALERVGQRARAAYVLDREAFTNQFRSLFQ